MISTKTNKKWLFWSLITVVLWGVWGLVSKVASAGVDAWVNQLLYTAGLAPLLIFVAFTVRRRGAHEKREGRSAGVFWAFFTGILGGVGNIFFFQAMVAGGKASVVAPVTALFPMITVLLAMIVSAREAGPRAMDRPGAGLCCHLSVERVIAEFAKCIFGSDLR